MKTKRIQMNMECRLQLPRVEACSIGHQTGSKVAKPCVESRHATDKVTFMSNRILNVFALPVILAILSFSLPSFAENELGAQELEQAVIHAQMNAEKRAHKEITPLHVFSEILSQAVQQGTLTNYFFEKRLGLGLSILEKKMGEVEAEINKMEPQKEGAGAVDVSAWDEFKNRMKQISDLSKHKAGLPEFLYTALELGAGTSAESVAKHLSSIGIDRALVESKSNLSKVNPDKQFEDLSKLASQGKGISDKTWGTHHPDSFRGRYPQIELLTTALSQSAQVPMLTGKSGSGKTSIVEELARLIHVGDSALPVELRSLKPQIIRVDLQEIKRVSYSDPKEVLTRLDRALDEAAKSPQSIVFIDNLDSLSAVKMQGGGSVLPSILDQLVSATRPNRYIAAGIDMDQAIRDAGNLKNAFIQIPIEDPDKDMELPLIMGSHHLRISQEHGIAIDPNLLPEIVRYSQRFLGEEGQPGSSIRLLEESAKFYAKQMLDEANGVEPTQLKIYRDYINLLQEQYDRLHRSAQPAPTKRQEKRLTELATEINKIKDTAFEIEAAWERGAIIRASLKDLDSNPAENQDEIAKLRAELKGIQNKHHIFYEELSLYHVAQKLYEKTGVPLNGILGSMQDRISTVEEFYNSRVIGQSNATAAAAEAQRRSASGFVDNARPTASIYAGPTGVGKTFLAKTEAEFMFGDPNAIITLDMAEFKTETDVKRILGAPPGYVGYEDKMKLLEQIRKRPYAVLLLDEIEKAHESFFDILLSILEEGRITDSHGVEVDCRNLRIIMTTNVGASMLEQAKDLPYDVRKRAALEALLRGDPDRPQDKFRLRPEILGRIGEDNVICFNSLSADDLEKIFKIELKKWERTREGLRFNEFILTPRAEQKLTNLVRERGSEFGARGIRGLITAALENPLATLATDEKTRPFVEREARMKIDYEEGSDEFTALVPTSSDPTCEAAFATLGRKFKAPTKTAIKDAGQAPQPGTKDFSKVNYPGMKPQSKIIMP